MFVTQTQDNECHVASQQQRWQAGRAWWLGGSVAHSARIPLATIAGPPLPSIVLPSARTIAPPLRSMPGPPFESKLFCAVVPMCQPSRQCTNTEYTRSYVLYYTIYLIKGYVGGGRSRVSGVSSIVHGSDRRTDGRTDSGQTGGTDLQDVD